MEQIQKLVGQLEQLLKQLQEMLGQKGCSPKQQDEALNGVAKGCGAHTPSGCPAAQSIQAVSSSFSASAFSSLQSSSFNGAHGNSASSSASAFSSVAAASQQLVSKA